MHIKEGERIIKFFLEKKKEKKRKNKRGKKRQFHLETTQINPSYMNDCNALSKCVRFTLSASASAMMYSLSLCLTNICIKQKEGGLHVHNPIVKENKALLTCSVVAPTSILFAHNPNKPES